MDPTTRAVLVEVARAVLRVLAPAEAPKAATPPPRVFVDGSTGQLKPGPIVGGGGAVRGDNVRVWTGDRYEVGQVIAIPRGTPRKVKVRIARAGARGKLVTIEADKAVKV